MSDWQPALYLKFERERTQPTIDLAYRIEAGAPRRVLDVGCGPGNSTQVLQNRWPGAEITGLDSSQSMLLQARNAHPDIHNWTLRDATGPLDDLGTFDVVFSNAALQWMPDHEALLPRLFDIVCPGGALALQVPYVRHLPIYRAISEVIAQPKWVDFFGQLPEYPRHYPFAHFYSILCTLSPQITAWQTDYIHILNSHSDIVEWYKGSGLRPFLDKLPDDDMRKQFCAMYHQRIVAAYPPAPDGRVLLPFTRLFLITYKK